MSWQHWLIIAWFIFNALWGLASVGKQYTLTAKEAVLMCFIYAALIAAVVSL